MDKKVCFYCFSENVRKHSLGRIYCLSCGRRYSLKRAENIKKAIEYFCLEIPANKASKSLKLNYKTIHRIYQKLRKTIYKESKISSFKNRFFRKGGKEILILVLEKDKKVFTELISGFKFEIQKILAEIHRQGFKAVLLHSKKFKSYSSLIKIYSEGLDNFWLFAKKRLKNYRAVSRKNFELYLHELAFRYNHKKSDLRGALLALWQKMPNKQKA